MGKYWTCIIYNGRLLTSAEYEKLKEAHNDVTVLRDNIIHVMDGTTDVYIYFNRIVRLQNIDPMVEAHEIRRGYVDMKEIDDLIAKYPKYMEEWSKQYDIDIPNSHVYFFQGSWWTLDPTDNSIAMEHNLPCEYVNT